MATREITKKIKKKRDFFGFISVGLWIGTALFCIIAIFCKIDLKNPEGIEIFTPEFKAWLISLGSTAIIGIILGFIIKDKIRTVVWMVCTVINACLFKDVGMYVTLAVWFTDEYIFHALYLRYKMRYAINKEIDKRM